MKRSWKFFACVAVLFSIGGGTLLRAQPPADGPPRGQGNQAGQGGPGQGQGGRGQGQGQGRGQGQGGPGQGGPRSQLMQALDTDKDGSISAAEIKNAPESLATLDKNYDGKLTQEEIRPQGPGQGGPGQGGPGQGRPQQGNQQGGPAQGNRQPQGNNNGANDVKAPPLAADQRALVFSGGTETDQRDGRRPVVLIAGALGVTPEVFRDAFSRVRPAGAGQQPEDAQVRENKAALMAALGKFGITNDRLDEVSNYYRYVHSRGESWPITPAQGYAKIKDGKVTGFVITRAGSGYSSPPTITVDGIPGASGQAKLAYGRDFSSNGSVVSVTAAQ